MEFREAFERLDQRDWDTHPDGTVGLAIAGVGGFARRVVLPSIADADYVEPTVLVSGSPDTETVAEDHGCECIAYDAFSEGALADAYDAVYVATPNALHLPHVETAANLGKDVICEKPLEATVDRAERLVAACDHADVTLMTAYRMQIDPVMRRLRAFLAEGGIGRVHTLHGDFTYPVLGSGGPDQWRLDPELAGGGALPDIGVYPLNTARFLLGADPLTVAGEAAGEGPFAGIDETVAFLLGFPEGVHGAFSASFSGPADTRLSVAGTEGRVEVLDAFVPRADRTVRIETEEGSATFEGLGADEVREEFDYFAHCVLAGMAPEPDGEDGLVDVRTMADVYLDAGFDVPMAR